MMMMMTMMMMVVVMVMTMTMMMRMRRMMKTAWVRKWKSHHLNLPTLFYFRMAKKTYGVNTLTLTKSCLLATVPKCHFWCSINAFYWSNSFFSRNTSKAVTLFKTIPPLMTRKLETVHLYKINRWCFRWMVWKCCDNILLIESCDLSPSF